jgi:cystathionine gamma-synthase
MKPTTAAIVAGSRPPVSAAHPLSPPVFSSAVGWFEDAELLDASLDGKDFVYGRIAAPNAQLLEEAIAALEGAAACAVFASGMAALRAVFDSQGLKAGDKVVVPADGYGATRALFAQLCAERGARLVPLMLAEPGATAVLKQVRPQLVLIESVTNPLVSVPDLPALCEAAHEAGAVVAVDGTFPSPIGQRAIGFGADFAVQSTTKWINGHSDALGGAVSGSLERIAPIKAARLLRGDIIGPFEAWLTLRGVRTLPLRMKAHGANALHVATALEASREVEHVRYPGLAGHPQHAIARRVLDVEAAGFGGMLTFEIPNAGRAQGFAFLEGVRLARPAPSLGDVATLVMHAASASARRLTPEERVTAGIGEGLIRVSVGLEDPEEIVADLLQAVRAARG